MNFRFCYIAIIVGQACDVPCLSYMCLYISSPILSIMSISHLYLVCRDILKDFDVVRIAQTVHTSIQPLHTSIHYFRCLIIPLQDMISWQEKRVVECVRDWCLILRNITHLQVNDNLSTLSTDLFG